MLDASLEALVPLNLFLDVIGFVSPQSTYGLFFSLMDDKPMGIKICPFNNI